MSWEQREEQNTAQRMRYSTTGSQQFSPTVCVLREHLTVAFPKQGQLFAQFTLLHVSVNNDSNKGNPPFPVHGASQQFRTDVSGEGVDGRCVELGPAV